MHRGPSYRAARAVIRPLVRATTRREWFGAERLPQEGGVILAANHLSFWDPVLVAYFVDEQGREPRFLAKSELFDWPVVGGVLRRTGQIPVMRETSAAGRAGDEATAAIRRGECVVVYPEGTLTRDPDLWPMRGRTGVARIALATGAPVIPMAQWGIQQICPPWSNRVRPVPRHDVRIALGEPLDLSDLAQQEPTRAVLESATERVLSAITELLVGLRGESSPETRFDPRTMGRERPTRSEPTSTDERQPRPMDTTTTDVQAEGCEGQV